MKLTIRNDWGFKQWRMYAGWSIDECCSAFDVGIRTVKNWEQGKSNPPRAVFLCLSLCAGDLSFLGKYWNGYKLMSDCIISADGEHLWHYEVNSIKYLYAAAGIPRHKLNNALNQEIKAENVSIFKRKKTKKVEDQKAIKNTFTLNRERIF